MARVSVLLPVHNGGAYLRRALLSILGQRYCDFELIVVDDASDDDTPAILSNLRDTRLRVVELGTKAPDLATVLNLGIRRCNGEYVARMDADDVAHPDRINSQVRFLDHHLDHGMVGSWCRLVDERDVVMGRIRSPSSAVATRWGLLFANPFVHSSVMFRKELVLGLAGYSNRFPHAEDFELWSRVADRSLAKNLPQYLTDLRIHQRSVSALARSDQLNAVEAISAENIRRRFGIDVPASAVAPLRRPVEEWPLGAVDSAIGAVCELYALAATDQMSMTDRWRLRAGAAGTLREVARHARRRDSLRALRAAARLDLRAPLWELAASRRRRTATHRKGRPIQGGH